VNVGLRGGYDGSSVVGLDLDIMDPDAAEAIGAIVRPFLARRGGVGTDVPYRVGLPPKSLFPVHVRGVIRKSQGREFAIGGHKCQVEVIGQGGQFLIAGTHPTGRPYTWPLDGPADLEPSDLPSLTVTELVELVELIEAELARRGTATSKAARRGLLEAQEARPVSLEGLRAPDRQEALAAALSLRNDDLSYGDWVGRAYAICGTFGPEEGWRQWLAFSEKSAKNDPSVTSSVWRGVVKAYQEGGTSSGWKRLFGIAEADGWVKPRHPAQGLINLAVEKQKREEAARARGEVVPATVDQIGDPEEVPVPGPYFPADELPADQATAELQTALRWALGEALASIGTKDRAELGLRAAAGLGKSTLTLSILGNPEAALEVVAKASEEIREKFKRKRLVVYYFAPKHRLNDELAETARKFGLRAGVLRGREAEHNGSTMCDKADVVSDATRLRVPIMESFCWAEKGEKRCEFFESCRYMAQFRNSPYDIIFMPHEYLYLADSLPRIAGEGIGLSKPDLVIVDEAFELRAHSEKS
jgi:hypothetical protein